MIGKKNTDTIRQAIEMKMITVWKASENAYIMVASRMLTMWKHQWNAESIVDQRNADINVGKWNGDIMEEKW